MAAFSSPCTVSVVGGWVGGGQAGGQAERVRARPGRARARMAPGSQAGRLPAAANRPSPTRQHSTAQHSAHLGLRQHAQRDKVVGQRLKLAVDQVQRSAHKATADRGVHLRCVCTRVCVCVCRQRERAVEPPGCVCAAGLAGLLPPTLTGPTPALNTTHHHQQQCTSPIMPKSRYASRPSRVRSRLPGCGSAQTQRVGAQAAECVVQQLVECAGGPASAHTSCVTPTPSLNTARTRVVKPFLQHLLQAAAHPHLHQPQVVTAAAAGRGLRQRGRAHGGRGSA